MSDDKFCPILRGGNCKGFLLGDRRVGHWNYFARYYGSKTSVESIMKLRCLNKFDHFQGLFTILINPPSQILKDSLVKFQVSYSLPPSSDPIADFLPPTAVASSFHSATNKRFPFPLQFLAINQWERLRRSFPHFRRPNTEHCWDSYAITIHHSSLSIIVAIMGVSADYMLSMAGIKNSFVDRRLATNPFVSHETQFR